MHIIAGKNKGKKLLTLEGKNTRPTLTRIKENIFNILQNYCDFEEVKTIDFFGGSGALSCEALSRGAKFAYINDINQEACKIILNNITSCNYLKQSKVSNLDYQNFIKTIDEPIDIFFIDPPFANLICQQWIVDYLVQNPNKIKDQGLLVFETNTELKNLQLNSNFNVVSDKRYGKIFIKIIQYNKDIRIGK